MRRANAAAKPAKEVKRLEPGGPFVEQLALCDVLVDEGVSRRQPQAPRLRHRQRPHGVRPQRGGVERDHGAVGVADEMCSVTQQLGDEGRLGLEVAPRERRARAETGTVGHKQVP